MRKRHYEGRAEELAARLARAPDLRAAVNRVFHTLTKLFEALKPPPCNPMAEVYGEVVLLDGVSLDELGELDSDELDDNPSDEALLAFQARLDAAGGVESVTGGFAGKLAELERLLDEDDPRALGDHTGRTLVSFREFLDAQGASTDDLDDLEALLDEPIETAKHH